jgi:phosphonate transport system substrate-binding protein
MRHKPVPFRFYLGSGKRIVKFGVISRYNPRIMYKNYQPIMDYLTENTPFKFELKLGGTYLDTLNFLAEGKVDVASLGAVTYLEAHKKFRAVPILRPLNHNGEALYHSITIVRRDSAIKELKDLKGKSFAFASIRSTSGNLFPRYYLAKSGIHLKDLKNYVNLGHHDSVARAVLKGEFDAGAVKDVVANKYKIKGLKFIFYSDPIPSVPIVVRKDTPPEVVEAIKKAFLAIDINDPDTKKMMESWDPEFRNGFVEASDADYEGVRKMFNEIPRGCGNGCHPEIYF